MISQWLVVISEYTGNLGSGVGLVQVRLEGGQSPGWVVSSEGRLRRALGCSRGLGEVMWGNSSHKAALTSCPRLGLPSPPRNPVVYRRNLF